MKLIDTSQTKRGADDPQELQNKMDSFGEHTVDIAAKNAVGHQRCEEKTDKVLI